MAQQCPDHVDVDPRTETGTQQCSEPVEFSLGWWASEGHSSGLVNAFPGQFRGVAGPVPAGLVDPVDGGGGGDVEQVGQDGGGQGPRELGERGASSGLGVDTEGAEAFAEAGWGQRSPGEQAGEQPRGWVGGSDADVVAAVGGQVGQEPGEGFGDGDLVSAEPEADAVVAAGDLVAGDSE